MKVAKLTNTYGLARSVIALGLLSVFLFNGPSILFSEYTFTGNYSSFLDTINIFKLFGYEKLWLSYAISIAILFSVLIGVFPRYTGILHWWVTCSFFSTSLIVEGGDQLAVILTAFLIPVTLMDSRKNHFSSPLILTKFQKGIASITFLFISLQVALLYLESGIGKLYLSEQWSEGSAIYYWLNNSMFARKDFITYGFNFLFKSDMLTAFATYSVVIFEICIFGGFFIASVKTRKILFKLAIIFHLSIVIFFGLPAFFLNMAGALILFLCNKNEALIDVRFKKLKNKFNYGV